MHPPLRPVVTGAPAPLCNSRGWPKFLETPPIPLGLPRELPGCALPLGREQSNSAPCRLLPTKGPLPPESRAGGSLGGVGVIPAPQEQPQSCLPLGAWHEGEIPCNTPALP
ncbi:macrophage mannose receptor 1-like [Platysternon megacephalum]|uniref:Macrophage mannose receptor 1-like n=1 Tax=Platysternon megacephalum TaxID=55544 RepID=A0A4D9DTU3_9SAUR|nr:macrophage mannose receptor 1-like [Platysternon megacephalum]